MGYVALNAYDADLRIPEFRGLMQYGDGINADPRTASEAENVDTLGGVLQPSGACVMLNPSTDNPIETLASLYRRWYSGENEKTVLVAASDGQLYYMLEGGSSWTLLDLPDGWGGVRYSSNVWSFVAYEINPEESEAPVDVLIMSNALDGMIYIRGDDLSVHTVETPKKFGVITRYAERIWGGAIPDDPDMLVYSAPFDPTDWSANFEIPEDGAGDVMQPSWDGDSFQALTPLGSQLIAFKKNRIWRVMNTDPGEYVFKEQYGGGASYARTVAVDGEFIFMLSRHGLMIYDGANTQPFGQEVCKAIWDSLNVSALDQACACMYKGAYYCAVPTGTSPTNNAVVIYNTKDRTWLYRTDVAVESFLPTNDVLYFTSSASPSNVFTWNPDSWESASATASAVKWVGQWQDFGHKDIRKGGFVVYLTVEAKAAGILTIGIETEKKTKTKTYSYAATTSVEAKQKMMRFGGNGRRFRFFIESDDGVAWRLVGGLQIKAETDVD